MGVPTATDTPVSAVNTASSDLLRVQTTAAPVRTATLPSPERQDRRQDEVNTHLAAVATDRPSSASTLAPAVEGRPGRAASVRPGFQHGCWPWLRLQLWRPESSEN